VDSREACLREAGELIDAQVKGGDVCELRQVLSGGAIGHEKEGGVFCSNRSVSFASLFRQNQSICYR
jgi:ornithine cyclodeaminase/alanine dehydrogenase-like protein (mu-crystallin family)